MQKISDKFINFIESMKNRKVEVRAGRKTLAVVEVQSGIFQGDSLLPLPFVIAITSLSYTPRKCTGGRTTNLQNRKKRLIILDDLRLFAKNEKEPVF